MYWIMVILMMVVIVFMITPQCPREYPDEVVSVRTVRRKRPESDYWLVLAMVTPLLLFLLGWLYEIVVAYFNNL